MMHGRKNIKVQSTVWESYFVALSTALNISFGTRESVHVYGNI